jgi:hypothetical protein
MSRSPHETYEHHLAALGDGDVDAIAADYAEDAVLVMPDGVVRGRAAIRETLAGLLAQLPPLTWDVPTRVYADDVLLIEWSAAADTVRLTGGVDTFLFSGGEIRVHTIRFTPEPAA